MKVDHTFAMTDGFFSSSEVFFMDRIIWNIIFHMKSNYYFLNLERILNSLCEILGDDFANKSAQNIRIKNRYMKCFLYLKIADCKIKLNT